MPSMLQIAPLGGELGDDVVEYQYEGPFPVMRIEGARVVLGNVDLEVRPDTWTPATHWGMPAAVSGGWVGDAYHAHLRMLETPFTYAVELSPNGHLQLGTDIGFQGPDLFWEGDPVGGAAANSG